MTESLKGNFTLLVFHGSDSSASDLAAASFSKMLAEQFSCSSFEICFLRRAPYFENSLKTLCADGAACIKVIPLLLLPGSHTERDINETVTRTAKEFSDTKITVCKCLAENEGFAGYVADRIKE